MSAVKDKKLKLLWAKGVATTYTFKVEDDFGWAYCTVNDGTGELHITSDWGTWSYLWSPKQDHLGAASLTHFIGNRGSVEYIKNKLLPRYGQVFCAEATTKHLQKMIAKQRRSDRREQRVHSSMYVYGGAPDASQRGRRYLTRESSRDLWDELEGLASDIPGRDDSAATLYIERAMQIDGIDDVCEEIWNEIQYVESNDSKVLRQVILPALVEACSDRVRTDPHYILLKGGLLARRAATIAAEVGTAEIAAAAAVAAVASAREVSP